MIPVALIFAIFDIRADIAIYGLRSSNPLDVTGLIVLMLFAIKAIVAFGIFKEKEWAFKIGIWGAILGVLICLCQFGILDYFANKPNVHFEFRLEIIFLMHFLLYLLRNRSEWIEKIKV